MHAVLCMSTATPYLGGRRAMLPSPCQVHQSARAWQCRPIVQATSWGRAGGRPLAGPLSCAAAQERALPYPTP